LTDAGEAEDILPTATALQSIHPNPFNPATTIAFDISKRTRVKLTIYDAAGRMVCVLNDEVMGRGRPEAVWNGRNSEGVAVASGAYFCRLSAGNIVQTEKMVLLR
jgi:flagellar hook assembly protein FlgD